jgi:ABC-type polysaccharide/polyol phosphate transport system ATPase subunit
MMIRLAFSISTCIPPDILIMDEWLTAGDAQFLGKAQRRIEEFVRHSSILVLASHSLELAEQWCSRGILLHHGRMLTLGPIKEVVAAYRRLIDDATTQDLAPIATAV